MLERLKAYLCAEIFPLALAYHSHHASELLLTEQGIKYYWSYELQEE